MHCQLLRLTEQRRCGLIGRVVLYRDITLFSCKVDTGYGGCHDGKDKSLFIGVSVTYKLNGKQMNKKKNKAHFDYRGRTNGGMAGTLKIAKAVATVVKTHLIASPATSHS